MSRGRVQVPASVIQPTGASPARPLPVWIVLHGMTRPGRSHAQLQRFVRALASTRAVVIVPEIPEWVRLELSTVVTLPTVRGALDLARALPEADPERTGLVGFSFGAPQAILTAADPSVRDEIAGVAGFGGYCDLERTVRFQLTGVHEWKGQLWRIRPDPYGRWIVGANFLAEVYRAADPVARALWTLAAEAGDRQVSARDPSLTVRAQQLRKDLTRELRTLFDRFVPPDGQEPEPEAVEDLVIGLSSVGRHSSSLLDPGKHMEDVNRTVHIMHGRGDQLIPYSEALRTERWLRRGARRDDAQVHCTVTELFSHSSGSGMPPIGTLVREGSAFCRALAAILGATEREA